MLSISNDIYGGTGFHESTTSKLYEHSIEKSRIARDHRTVKNSLGGSWLETDLGELVPEERDVVNLHCNVPETGLNNIIEQDRTWVEREMQDIFAFVFGYHYFTWNMEVNVRSQEAEKTESGFHKFRELIAPNKLSLSYVERAVIGLLQKM